MALGASLKQLVIEKLSSDQPFDLAVRDVKTGFTFFNVEGHQYDYDPAASCSRHRRKTTHFKGLCQRTGPTRDVDAHGQLEGFSVGTAMQPIEITQLANGEPNRWRCHRCNVQSGRKSRTLCPARMLSLAIS